RHRAVDDAGVAVTGLPVVDAQLLQRPDAKVLQHHVEDLDQAKKELPASIFLEIDLDALLVAVQTDEVGGFGLIKWWPPCSGDVPDFRNLDFDDLRSEVSQQCRTKWPGQGMGEIENFHVL